MNPPDWNIVQRVPREPMQDVDRKQWAGTEKRIRKFTVNDNDHHSQHGHYSYHQREQQRPTEWMEVEQHSIPSPSPSSCRELFADLRSETTMNPAGPSVEVTEKNNELERKKKQLEQIQNRIIRTKAAIALKKLLPYLKKTEEPPDIPFFEKKENDLAETCLTTDKEASLKERVKCILQLKKSLGLPKIHCRDPTRSTKDGGGQQEDHPLKLCVKTLMNHRQRINRESHSRSEFNPGCEMWHAVDDQRMQVNHFPPMNPRVPPPTALLNPPPAVPVQSPAVPEGFQQLQVHNRTAFTSGFGLWHAVDGQSMQFSPYPPMYPSVPPSATILNPPPVVPEQRPAAGFQHLQHQKLNPPKQSNSGTGLNPGFPTWLTMEGQAAQVHPFPPMSPNERPRTPSPDPPSPGPEQRLGSPAGFQHLQPHERSQTPSPDSPSPAPLQRPAAKGVAKGFQRFLDVLNKGVDIDVLTSIINDDSQSIPLNKDPLLNKPLLKEPSKLENNLIEPHQNDSRNSQAAHRCHSRSNSLSGSIELPDPEGSHKERNTPTNELSDELNDRCNSPSPSGSSPPAEEENPTQLQLQKILKTLGLCFEEEEISGLTNRTKERLYGKKKDNGQGLRKTSGSEKPCEPSREIHPSNSTSVPAHPGPAIPPPQHPQEKDSMECMKRRRSSPCSQSRERSSHDSQPRESRDKDKRQDRDSCGDTGTDKGQVRDNSEDAQTEKRQDGDSETDKWWDRYHHRDAETDQWQHRDCNGNAETDKRQDRDCHRDSETDKWWDTKRCKGDAETDKRPTEDSEKDQWRRKGRPRDSKKRRHRFRRHRDAKKKKGWDRGCHRNSETGKRRDSSHVNALGATAPYPHRSSFPQAQNPPYHLPKTGYSYQLPHPPMSSYHLPAPSSPATSTPLHADYLLNPDLSKSEGQHWSAQRCLQVINITKPLGSEHCLTPLKDAVRCHKQPNNPKENHKNTSTSVRLKAAAKAAVVSGNVSSAEVLVAPTEGKQEAVEVQREPTEEEIKAKLKEKLKAFNQKMKQRPIIPVQNSSCSTYSDLA